MRISPEKLREELSLALHKLTVASDVELEFASEGLCVAILYLYLVSNIDRVDLLSPQSEFDCARIILYGAVGNIRLAARPQVDSPCFALLDDFTLDIHLTLLALEICYLQFRYSTFCVSMFGYLN